MNRLHRRLLIRLALLQGALLGALACGGTQCDCVTPLPEPIAEDAKLYDAVQARLTSQAFAFIEENIPTLIEMFLGEGGLEFDVEHIREEFCAPPFDWPCFVLHICEDGCTITIEIVDASLSRVEPNVLGLDAHLDINGTITISGDLDCDVPIHVQNKPVHADVLLQIDPDDHLMFVQVGGVDVSLSNSDYSLECSWWYDWLMEILKGVITDQINNAVGDQLDGAMDDALRDLVCLPCDFYSLGCPAGSSCDGGYCVADADGQCLTNVLGMAGTLDLGELLADVSPGLQAEMDILVAAGQWSDPSVDPLVLDNGVELRMIGGADTTRHACVPEPDPAEVPSNASPPRMPFNDVVPGTGEPYMTGIAISDAFLDWFMYKSYLTGMLCLSLGTETTDMLSSSTIALLGMGSLNDLTGGRNVPVRLELHPQHVPFMEIGAGILSTDDQGETVIEEPLLYIFMPGMALDFYVLLDEHWTRIVTITLDMSMEAALDLTPDNHLIVLFGEESIHLDNVVVSNHELLAEDPATLADLLPTLVGMALPMLTDALEPIEIPPVEGFVLDIQSIQGDMARTGTDFYEYLGMYANLEFAPPPPQGRATTARLLEVRVPDLELMSLGRPGGPMYPEVLIEAGTAAGVPAEFSYRVDGGFWRPFTASRLLRVHDPRLLLMGRHRVEVRARTPGAYRTLDTSPAAVEFEIRPPGDAWKNFTLSPVDWHARSPTAATGLGTAGLRPAGDHADEAGRGCACGHHAPLGPACLFLLLLALRRRGR